MGLVGLVFVLVFDSTAASGERSDEAVVAADNVGEGTGTSDGRGKHDTTLLATMVVRN